MASKGLILVTGASGFYAGHIVHQLLEAGYSVRGTVRSSKVEAAKEFYASYGDRWQVFGFDDIVAGDLTEGLKGVEAVIHAASPLPGRLPAAAALEAAVEGGLNVLRQSEKAGIKRFVFISSIVTVLNSENTNRVYTDKDWNDVTREKALDPSVKNPFLVYYASKTLAEKAVWEFADSHPNIDVTTILPPFLYGPFAPGYRNPTASISALSTNGFIYGGILSPQGYPPPTDLLIGRWIDVRDAARAAVLALTSPPQSAVGRKRILISGEWFSFGDAAEYIASVRPELKGRISQRVKDYPREGPTLVDNTRAKEVLGLDNIKTWKESVLEAAESVLALEKQWKEQGLKPN